jgi:tyrosyl-tRNA synthetase
MKVTNIVELLAEGFTMSKSEVRRKIKEGGFKVDGVKLIESDWFDNETFECHVENLDGTIVQFGKRKFRRFVFDPEENDFQIWG